MLQNPAVYFGSLSASSYFILYLLLALLYIAPKLFVICLA